MEEPTFYPATVRCAVVTGSSKGIGLEICRQLASKGITVILTARDEKKGSEAVADLNNCGLSNVVFHQLDVQDSSSISSLAKFIQTHFGILDILVNNAGVLGGTFDNDLPDDPDNPMKVTKQTFEEARECLDTNYYGLKRVTEALITLLKLSNSGNIVNVSSSAGKLKASQDISSLKDIAGETGKRITSLASSFMTDIQDRIL